MISGRDNDTELTRDEYTEYIYGATCFGEPANPQCAEDVTEGIERTMELESRPAFLEGLSVGCAYGIAGLSEMP